MQSQSSALKEHWPAVAAIAAVTALIVGLGTAWTTSIAANQEIRDTVTNHESRLINVESNERADHEAIGRIDITTASTANDVQWIKRALKGPQ